MSALGVSIPGKSDSPRGVALASAQTAPTLILDHGHTDIFNVSAEGAGLELNLKEDVTGLNVLHDPSEVQLVVKSSAYSDSALAIPEVGASGYLLPLTQDQNLLWPGWDTQGVRAAGYDSIDLKFISVAGPGQVFLFTSNNLGGVASLLGDGTYEVKTGEAIAQETPSHTHANWLFTQPGVYTMQVQAVASDTGVASDVKTYVWSVGDGESATGAVNTTNTQGAQNATAPTAHAAQTPAGANTAGAAGTLGAQAQQGQVGAQTAAPTYALAPRLTDDRVTPSVVGDPSSAVFGLSDAAKATPQSAIGSIPAGQDVWMVGAVQTAGVPWIGASTMTQTLLDQTSGELTMELTGFSGPGSMEVFTSGNFGQVIGEKWFSASGATYGGSVVIPRNTHVHPNWVFSAPGSYDLTITMSATSTDGTPLSGVTTLHFLVGSDFTGSGTGFDEGHFDLGAEVVEVNAAPLPLLSADPSNAQLQTAPVVSGVSSEELAASQAAIVNQVAELVSSSQRSRHTELILGVLVFLLGLLVCLVGVVAFRRARIVQKPVSAHSSDDGHTES